MKKCKLLNRLCGWDAKIFSYTNMLFGDKSNNLRGGHPSITSHGNLDFQLTLVLGSWDFQGGKRNFYKNSVFLLENPQKRLKK